MTANNPTLLANTLLGIFHARGLYVADEIRVDSLQRLWMRAGAAPADFERALRFLTAGGFLRRIETGRSACLRLTRKGYGAIQRPVIERRYDSMPERPPVTRQVRIRPPAPTAASLKPDGPDASQLAKARLFGVPNLDISERVLHEIVLGLFRERRLPAGRTVAYRTLYDSWRAMDLPEPALLRAVDDLVRKDWLRTAADGAHALRLTQAGRSAVLSEPDSLQPALDRCEARRHLRKTRRLGELRRAS